MNAKVTDPFDFSDTSDLPEEIAKGLKNIASGADKAKEYADIVIKAAEAGFDSVSISQIMAAAFRMGKDVPTKNAVRKYLNDAEALGIIHKPTRQTYAPGKARRVYTKAAEVVTAEPDPVVTSEITDPLAAL